MKSLFLNLGLLVGTVISCENMQLIPQKKNASQFNDKMNVLLISTDHELLYGHGTDRDVYKIKRPVMDNFCSQSVRFINAKSASPLCSPARRSVLTGTYPHNHGIVTNDVALDLYTEQETLYDAYLQNGFDPDNIYFYGKTHYGGSKGDITPQSTYGVNGWGLGGYGQPYTTNKYQEYLKKNNYFGTDFKSPVIDVVSNLAMNGKPAPGTEFDLAKMGIITGNIAGIAKTPKEFHESYFLANLANEQLREIASNEQEEPFVMTVNMWGPHHPYYPSSEFVDMYRDENGVLGGDIPEYPSFNDDYIDKSIVHTWDNQVGGQPTNFKRKKWKDFQSYMALAYAQHTQVDAAIGTILETLDETGLADNTVVMWICDHGDAAGSHGGHADKECYLTEEINTINMIYRNPQMSDLAGTISNEWVGTCDVPVTMLAQYGLKMNNPDTYGIDLAALLRKEIPSREYIVSETHGHFSNQIARCIYFGQYKYVYFDNDIDEFYDLNADPYEMNNLIFQPELQGIISVMRQKLRDWQVETRDPFGYVNY